jgi:hypothetical protein
MIDGAEATRVTLDGGLARSRMVGAVVLLTDVRRIAQSPLTARHRQLSCSNCQWPLSHSPASTTPFFSPP